MLGVDFRVWFFILVTTKILLLIGLITLLPQLVIEVFEMLVFLKDAHRWWLDSQFVWQNFFATKASPAINCVLRRANCRDVDVRVREV